MVNVVIRSNGLNVPDAISEKLAAILQSVELDTYQVKDYVLCVCFDFGEDEIKKVHPLDGVKKYILFQNIPQNSNYDVGFEAQLSKLKIRLQRFTAIDDLDYKNVAFIFDFSQAAARNDAEVTSNEDADRRAMFVPVVPKYKLDSVVMSETMKTEIDDALSIIRNRNLIYEDWGYKEVDPQARAVLCFYGPAGTGKTKCAHGFASALNRKILCVNYANIESKWAGEAPKNLISAFNVAQESNAVLFMDEADSFLGKRITNVSSGHDQSINSLRSQMLILLEDFDGVVIFGTNLVENFDKAFETRILKSIRFELPNEDSRFKLFQLMIPARVPFDSPLAVEDYREFSKRSEGFSGREIRNVVLDALSRGAKDEISAFTPQMFVDAIERHVESLEKLKQEKAHKEAAIEAAVTDSLLSESKRIYHEALIQVAVCAMRCDGVLDDREKNLIEQTARLLDIETPAFDDVIPALPDVCEHFITIEQKRAALDIACKVIAADSEMVEDEISFIENLCDSLGYLERFDEVLNYIHLLVEANNKLLELA